PTIPSSPAYFAYTLQLLSAFGTLNSHNDDTFQTSRRFCFLSGHFLFLWRSVHQLYYGNSRETVYLNTVPWGVLIHHFPSLLLCSFLYYVVDKRPSIPVLFIH